MKYSRSASAIFVMMFIILMTAHLYSQSPYYSVKLSIADTFPESYIYVVQEHRCLFDYNPVIRSGDYWFGKDTSVLNWKNLPDSMYNFLGCKKITGKEGKKFENGAHSMIWENILTLTITRRNLVTDGPVEYDTMTIVFPVIQKSFVTYIDLGTINFKEGYFEMIDEFIYDRSEWLKITIPADMEWNSTAFENRKIKIDPYMFDK